MGTGGVRHSLGLLLQREANQGVSVWLNPPVALQVTDARPHAEGLPLGGDVWESLHAGKRKGRTTMTRPFLLDAAFPCHWLCEVALSAVISASRASMRVSAACSAV